jgi:hypothetical protein
MIFLRRFNNLEPENMEMEAMRHIETPRSVVPRRLERQVVKQEAPGLPIADPIASNPSGEQKVVDGLDALHYGADAIGAIFPKIEGSTSVIGGVCDEAHVVQSGFAAVDARRRGDQQAFLDHSLAALSGTLGAIGAFTGNAAISQAGTILGLPKQHDPSAGGLAIGGVTLRNPHCAHTRGRDPK